MKTIKELGINLTNAFNNASYWNHKGAYQKEGDELFEKLVPSEGAAPTLHGELIRGINILFHEYCNNGNANAVLVTTPNDHPWDYDEDVDGEIDWDEIEDVEINEYYGKFLDLIESSLTDKIKAEELKDMCNDVRGVIEDGAYNLLCHVYFSEENVNKYNLMCDVVIWYVLNSEDRELPANYDRKSL